MATSKPYVDRQPDDRDQHARRARGPAIIADGACAPSRARWPPAARRARPGAASAPRATGAGGRRAPPSPPTTTNSTQSCGIGEQRVCEQQRGASRRRPARSAAPCAGGRRASASAPPTNAMTSIGTSSAMPEEADRERGARELGRSGTERATNVTIEPRNETAWPTKRSRNSRLRRSGPMSMVRAAGEAAQPSGADSREDGEGGGEPLALVLGAGGAGGRGCSGHGP